MSVTRAGVALLVALLALLVTALPLNLGALAPHRSYAPATPDKPQLAQVIWQFVSRYQVRATPQPTSA